MAWNEPGGNKNKDPWGNRGNDQGPPDLDEVFKKFMDKLNSVLGGSGGGSRGSSSGNNKAGIIALLVIGAVIWLLSGTYKIAEAERGVVMTFGEHTNTVGSGLHWHIPSPFQKVIKIDVSTIQQFPLKSTMLTQDQNIIDVDITVQYKVGIAEDYIFNMRNPTQALAEATESALRQHIGRSTMDYVFRDGREDIAESTKITIQEILDIYESGIEIIVVNLQEAKPPEAVRSSFDDVTQAVEDEIKFKNQAESYRNEILPAARGESAKRLEEAKAYKAEVVARAEGDAQRFTSLYNEYRKAPAVTRDRMYIETVEQVLSQSSKIMIDIKGGNNMMYLPLDKLLENRDVNRSAIQRGGSLMDSGRNDFNSDSFRTRSTRTREVR